MNQDEREERPRSRGSRILFEEDTDRSWEDEQYPVEEASAAPREHRFITWLRERRKAKADKAFDAAYGGADPSNFDDPGPRAALYEGQMGRHHRRAQRKAATDNGPFAGGSAQRAAKQTRTIRHPRRIIGIAIAACLVFSCAFLYGPARTYYQQVREHDRLEAELAAVTERNEAIQGQIDDLSTDAGVETRARSEFGWVKEGEQSLSVSGLDRADEVEISGTVMAADIDPPQTWYSPLLDVVFGVS